MPTATDTFRELIPAEAAPDETAHREHHHTKRTLRAAAWGVGVVLGASAVVGGSLTAMRVPGGEHLDIAGHDVSVRPVIGQDITNADGLAKLPAHVHIPVINRNIGLNVTPTDIGDIDPGDPATYTAMRQIGSDPEPEKHRIEVAAEHFMIRRGLEGGGPVAALELGGLLLYMRQRRKREMLNPEIAKIVSAHNKLPRRALKVVTAVAALGLIANGARIAANDEHTVIHPDPQLELLGVQGVELGPLAAKSLPIVLSFLPSTKQYYDAMSANADNAVRSNPALLTKPAPGVERFGIVDDFQNETGMAKVDGRSFALGHAAQTFVLGDWTDAGTEYEDSIFDSWLFALGSATPTVTTAGLHDTKGILSIAAKRGITLADDKTHDYDGVKVLALNDPRLSMFSKAEHGWELRDPNVTIDDFINDSVRQICETDPEMVVMHGSDLGPQLIKSADQAGCPIHLLINGRSYDFIGPRYYQDPVSGGNTVMLTVGSGGGHESTAPDPGIIEHTASAIFLDVNTATGEVSYYVETAQTDGSVQISPAININVPYSKYLRTGRTGIDADTQPEAAAKNRHVEASDTKPLKAKTIKIK